MGRIERIYMNWMAQDRYAATLDV